MKKIFNVRIQPERILMYAVLIIWTLVVLFPVYWVLISSFKLPISVMSGATYVPWVDFQPSMKNYIKLLDEFQQSKILLHFWNSALVATVASAVSVFLGALAAYGLTRFEYKKGPIANKQLSFLFMSLRMLPPVSLVLAFLIMYQKIGLVDTRIGLIFTYIVFNLPLAVWILRDAFSDIPKELDESALIDGASWWRVFWNICLPLTVGSVTAVFLMCFIFNWNEFLFALVLSYQKSTTVPILLAQSATPRGVDWGRMSALTIFSIIPSVVAGLFLEKYLRKGLLQGSIKG